MYAFEITSYAIRC